MSNITYMYENARGSIIFSQDTGYLLSDVDGLQTDVSFQSTQSTSQVGETILSQTIPAKSITLSGSLKGADISEKRKKLLSIVSPLVPSTFYVIRDGKRWQLNGYASKTPLISDDASPDFQFSFRAPYSFWQSDEQSYELAGLTPLWRTPFHMTGTKKISQFTTDMFKFIDNNGDTPLCFRAILFAAGEVVNPVIYNADLNTYIRINKTFILGEKFAISTHEADKDLGNAVLFYGTNGAAINGFKYIEKGSDLDMRINIGGNILVADAAQGKPNLRCNITASGGERHSL